MSIVFWNDHFCSEFDVKIPLQDRGFLFGDGLFTTLRIENGSIEALERHLHRLEKQCHSIGIVPLIIKKAWLDELIIRNHALQGVWRLKIILTAGNNENLSLQSQRSGQLIIILKPYTGSHPASLRFYPDPICSIITKIKSLAYLDRLQIKNYALNNGFDDCIVKNEKGYILETAFTNIFWKLNSQIFIPDPSLAYYFGVSIERVIEAAKINQINVVFIKATEIPASAQVYLCNSMIGICPITLIETTSFSRDLSFEETFQIAYKNVV
jgi:4-amino-4-deoxychorismate lyase